MHYNLIASSASLSTFVSQHCPEFESLDRLDNKWAFFGTLTYAKNPPLPSTQVQDCIQLLATISEKNHSHTDMLQWVVRVEYSEGNRYHLHFLLGGDRIVSKANHYPFTVDEACQFLEKNWTHGRAEVVPYDPSEDGVGYITKGRNDQRPAIFCFSERLEKTLKKLPHSDWRELECTEIDRLFAYGVADNEEMKRRVKNRRKWKLLKMDDTVCLIYEYARP